jgi:hypothetical protein
MAKLKITDAAGNILEQGYVNVVNNLIANPANFQAFAQASPNHRPNMLQTFAADPAHPGMYVVKQETTLPAPQDLEPINNTNCQIFGDTDQLHTGTQPVSRVTVPLPVQPVTDVRYLQDYARRIHDLFEAGDLDFCCKFMLGVMLLTRCR